ncbi:hypothetical protein [Allobranchiibius sp. CTAmp26]|uniref:hypothetical protein n=1 Tax=Allobranchiibius sp. CTAmp26 TaxID=2815214 RepID=UPI001AA0D2B8|nr:hypothetical protein [Allobranchiibius sp. CTAmp26]MBO1756471.1 hypothetical protein [Allobranchiibius sp. CTAmp26]
MSQALQERSAAVSVAELKRAWSAVRAGDFRGPPRFGENTLRAASPPAATPDWHPATGDVVVPVLGCCGSSGATTLAVAIATAAGCSARVVECASVTSSGLVAASSAELGSEERVWSRGTRGEVVLERLAVVVTSVGEVPPPPTSDRLGELTVLDIGWEIGQVLGTPSWVADVVRDAPHLVLTTTATVPGLRRLEGALSLLDGGKVCAAVLGPQRAKWAKSVQHTAERAVERLDSKGAFFAIPHDRALAHDGLTSAALPTPLLDTARRLLERLLDHDRTVRTPHS